MSTSDNHVETPTPSRPEVRLVGPAGNGGIRVPWWLILGGGFLGGGGLFGGGSVAGWASAEEHDADIAELHGRLDEVQDDLREICRALGVYCRS